MKRHSVLRRLLCLVLVGVALVSLSACSKYRVEMSSAAESATMLTAGEEEVAFEVVSFFYHTRKNAYPDEDFTFLMTRVEQDIGELYGILAACRAAGIDPYGDMVNERVDEEMRSVIDSFPTRRDYIKALKEKMHATDRVYRLLLRSAICEETLSDMLEPSKAELRAFCENEDVIRVKTMSLYFGTGANTSAGLEWAEGRMADILAALDAGEDFLQVARRLASADSMHTYITSGQWAHMCGPHAPEPEVGVRSAPLYEIDSVLLMEVAEKDIDYAMSHMDLLLDSYIEYQIETQAEAFLSSMTRTEAYQNLDESHFA